MDLKPRSLLKRVLRYARAELERRTQERMPMEPISQSGSLPGEQECAAPSSIEPVRAPQPEVHGLEVVRSQDGNVLTLRWSITEDDVARAEALVEGSPVLCLRLVSFTKARDDVLREVQDRPGVELAGECEIGEPAQRAVVSLGLRAGERFVSIAHHVL